MQTLLGKHWHHLPREEVLEILSVDPDKGLDRFELGHRREHFGPNRLTEKRARSPLVQFLLQFHQPLVYILLATTAVTLAFAELVESAVIFGVVLVNAIVGYLQEAKALRAISALAGSLTSEAAVLRAGRKERVPSEDLVPGDVVLLQSGDKVPADLRLVAVRDLQVNESALTGESVPTPKEETLLPRDLPLGDRRNMAYSSTLVTYGTAVGVVVATGDATEIGRISELISSTEVLQTPLTKKVHAFSNLLLGVILGLAALTFAAGMLHGQKAFEMFMASVALAVGAIPEGLPAAVTIIMAAGVARMAARRAIIRKLPAVETLGSTTVICTDKTGTLTQNQMTVQVIVAGGETFSVTGTGWDPVGQLEDGGSRIEPEHHASLRECLRAGLLANDAEVVHDGGRWTAQGDPTEAALVVAARKGGFRPEDARRECPRLDAIPFESQHQYMATLHDAGPGLPRVVYLKGALEKVLERSGAALTPDGVGPLDPDTIRKAADGLAASGLRVLALARKELPEETRRIGHGDIGEGMVFLGLQAMMDPPRPEAAAAIAACRRAGVRVKMITGDHAVTAAAIARQIGIGEGEAGGPKALSGRDLDGLADAELIEAADRVDVFARVSPEHKLRLVEGLQARGNVVAMTGDGVNDAPALRRADIGVAMALGGTEVAREAADMVLTDDNFATIEAAVEEGRGVFDNLRKFIVWTLPTNGGECLVLLTAILLGATLPVVPIQLLWINMTTAAALGLTLAFEPKEPGLMDHPPHDPRLPLLDGVLIGRVVLVSLLLCGAVFALFEWELWRGSDVVTARTSAVTMIVVGELVYLFNCRSLSRSAIAVGLFSNPWAWAGAGVMLTLQLAFAYLPTLNRLFGSAPIDAPAWGVIALLSLALSAVVGLEKKLRSRVRRRAGA
ncbi:MAG: cation-transporting P-type ATPase [Acidobacteria bacterium]|nr:cation-transporting P-type ATPase [Acidobacteriota bacterium]